MKTIFEQQTLTGFDFDSSWSAYTNGYVTPPQFIFSDGLQYEVYFDGETFFCTAFSFVTQGMKIVAIGNGAYVGQSGNDEPFLLTYNKAFDNSQIFTIKTDASHTIAIYQESAEESETPEIPDGDGFILKNYHGEDVLHEGVDRIVFNGADGGEVIFSEGDAVDNVPITLDFSNGDQTVTAPDGTLVKSAVIEKPETLTAENIADGVNVAGILGTHKGGGGGSIKFVEKRGTYYAEKADGVTVRHNLGVLPDIVTIKGYSAGSKTGDIISIECCPNEDISCYTQTVQARTASGEVSLWSEKTQIANVVGGGLLTVTPNTFSVGGSLFKNAVGVTYEYRVIGGLIERPYVEIALNLDGDGNLIVTGGVPEIEQLNVYVDGVIAKTVDYVHSDEFIVDISDVAREFREYTISVEAVGDSFKAKYPIALYESVVGYVGSVSGSCGNSVNYTMYGNGTLEIYGTGAMADYAATSDQPWSNYASAIKRVVVSEGVTSTGVIAFQYTAAETIELPNSLTKIGNNFAYGCRSLASINIPDNVKSIGSSAFNGCTSLASVRLPDGLTALGNYAFYGCTALTNVTIPEGVTSIEQYTFSKSSIESIIIPDKVTQILWRAFQDCTKLKTATIGSSVSLIGDNTFLNCSSLTSVIFKDTTTWRYNSSQTSTSGTTISSSSLANATTAATYLRSTYVGRWWHKV